MTTDDFKHIRASMIDDVVHIETLDKHLLGPEAAQELGAELSAVAAQDWAGRMLVDLRHTASLGSTVFAVLFKLVSGAKAAGRQVKFCNLNREVRLGADIIGLGKIAEIHDGERAALEAFSKG